MQWEPNSRDKLIDMVRRGQLSPAEAELEAQKQGCGPLATKPNPIEFDPNEMPWWSLPMAIAWIAWRNRASVREHCAEYRDKWLDWVPVSWYAPSQDGNDSGRIAGHELKAAAPSTVCYLSLAETLLKSEGQLPGPAMMSVSEAEKQLFTALAAGRIVGVAKDDVGRVVEIPQREWPYLKLFTEKERDVLKHHALDQQPAFSDIRLERDKLRGLWGEYLIERYMIEPMMREGAAGYVPLCAALHWTITEGGRQIRYLEDKSAWDNGVGKLLPRLSTGEIEIVGNPVVGGAVEKIAPHVFAQIYFTQPLSDSIFGLGNGDPWVSCTPFVDEHHWLHGFNDQLFLRAGTNPAWTHLQVKKPDVLREFSFPETPSLGLSNKFGSNVPPMQAAVLEAAEQLWPDGNIPPRTKERNAAISKQLKTPVSDKTIQRAFARKD